MGNTATSGVDFTANSGQGTITAGQTSTTITVDVTADTTVELSEQFFVEISNVKANGLDVTLEGSTTSLTSLGTFNTPGTAFEVAVVNGVAYVADSTAGLQIFDVSDPTNITLLSTFDTSGSALDVQVVNGRAYVADHSTGLVILDVSDPNNVSLLGSFDTTRFVIGVDVVGSVAYVADESNGLKILDVSDPTNITLLGSFDTPGSARGVDVVNGVAYVADFGSGLQVLDVSTPSSITLLGSFDTDGNAHNVQVVNGVAYVADDAGGLKILDVSDPSNITLLGSFGTTSASRGVQVVDGLVYLADAGSGLRILDVTDPANIKDVASLDTSGTSYGSVVIGSTIYLADGPAGLNILDFSIATQATGTITDDDSATLSINDVTQVEGDSGTTDFTFTVTLDNAVSNGFTVDYTTADDTATTADSDYVSATNTLNFAGNAGETQTFTVTVNGDVKVELNETFFTNLSNVQAGGLDVKVADGQGIGTVTNDDGASLSINDVSVTEGDSGTTNATFTVTLDKTTSSGFTVDYSTTDNTATTADGDYVANSGTLTFAGNAGETQTFTVAVNGDVKVELNETFFTNLSNVQAGGLAVKVADGQGAGTITNDDSATLSINDVSVTEGNNGTTNATFTVTLDNATDSGFTVDYSTTDNTATTADGDYVAASGTLTFAGNAGETQTFTVTVNGDVKVELNETFLANLSNVVTTLSKVDVGGLDVTIADGQGVGTITNDDQVVVVVGADAGNTPHVKVFNQADGSLKFSFLAYDASFQGGVRVATADINRDGVDDIITGAGPGGGPHVKVFDGVTGEEVRSFFAYASSFDAGVYVAGGDVNGDGFADIITGADAGGGPHVKVFDGQTSTEIHSFFAYDVAFTGGVRVAAGDTNGDGFADIVTGAGAGGGAHVKVFDGQTGAESASFFAFDPSMTNGVYIAAGDIDGDGFADILTGMGSGAEPHVRGFSGVNTGNELVNFFAYNPGFTGGVRVAVTDVDGDATLDIVTGAGPTGGPNVRTFNAETGGELDSFFAFDPDSTSGVFVA